MLSDFLWQGKRAKIAMSTLQTAKNKGGLRLFDIRKKQTALKIQWVKRITEDMHFKQCFTSH